MAVWEKFCFLIFNKIKDRRLGVVFFLTSFIKKCQIKKKKSSPFIRLYNATLSLLYLWGILDDGCLSKAVLYCNFANVKENLSSVVTASVYEIISRKRELAHALLRVNQYIFILTPASWIKKKLKLLLIMYNAEIMILGIVSMTFCYFSNS